MDKAYRDIDIQRLSEKVVNDYSELRVFREKRVTMVREAAGDQYGSNNLHVAPTKLNLMGLFQETMACRLVSQSPQCYLSTFNPNMRATVEAMGKWANLEMRRQRMNETFQRLVIDGFYGPAIARINLADPADAAMSAWGIKAGTPLIQRTDAENFVYDVNSSTMLGGEYYGWKVRLPIRVAKKMYGRNKNFDYRGDPDVNRDGDERIGRLSRAAGHYEVEDHVELWYIYYPVHKCIIVLSADCVYQSGRDRGKALWYQKWIGRDSGPCEVLAFGDVVGQGWPKCPMMDLYPIHMDYQNAARKGNQSIRDFKEITTYRRQMDVDGKTIQNTPHGGMAGMDDPDAVKTLMTGGKGFQVLNGAAQQYRENFNFKGGNLELIGGRGQQAGTAHQEELLQKNASASISDMQARTEAFVERCLRSWLWYPWNNPSEIQSVSVGPPNLPDVTATSKIYPATYPQQYSLRRVEKYDDLEMRIVPFSMEAKTPAQMLAFYNSVVQQLMPMQPMLEARGIMFDANFWLKLMGDLGNAPDLGQLYTTQEPVATGQGQGGISHQTMLPSNTTRTNIRQNASQRTEGGTAKQLIASAMDMDLGGEQEAA